MLVGFYLSSCIICLLLFAYNIVIDFKNLKSTKWFSFIVTVIIVSCIPMINFLFYIIPAMINGGRIDIENMMEE